MSEFLTRIANFSPKKLALLAMDLQAKVDRLEQARSEPIAIVGMGCRVPGGAVDPAGFWRLLRDGVDAITEIPAGRWDVDACWSDDPDEPGKMSTRYGGFLDQVDRFDPHFFGIAPREAVTLDPQQRLLLEVSWEALEHAGQAVDELFGSQSGVFVGISGSNYFHLQLQAGDASRLDTYVGTGNAVSVAAGRLSYVLGWHGPSVAIDTACSSSLVAVHLACQSLLNGECRLALAGGVNLILTPELNVVLSRSRMLATDGRCKTFDASADGFGRSEGCGVVVLKRLADARADGDRVLAVIRGSATNQDGRSSGLTAPNGLAQEALIREALARARVDPAQVGFIEAHGTGTALGDPIEMQAIGAALSPGRPADRPVLVGSVKTNLGHLDAAAGVVGLIKVVLSLEQKTIPPHLHFTTPNPHIPWSDLPVSVPTTLTPWPLVEGRRIAGVSSFGFSGTNVHLIVEDAPAVAPATLAVERPLHVLTISAKSEAALDALAGRYAQQLESTDVSFADLCFTANAGRSHFAHRLALVAGSAADARRTLLAPSVAAGSESARRRGGPGSAAPTVAFLFTGQGSQYAGMGRTLFETQPTFRRTLERCDELLRPHLEQPLLSVLYPAAGAESPLNETAYTQPALFAFEYALAELWQSWGVTPALLLGHSVGEYVAACVAGVFSLEDALMLVAARGRLMQALPRDGAMAAVWADQARVRTALTRFDGAVSLAAVNAPGSVVIAGHREGVRALCLAFEQQGIRTHLLNVSHAFHSPLMDPILDEFEQIASRVRYAPPKLGVISNATGRALTADEATTPAYWRRHIRDTVQFQAGVQTLAEQGCTAFVELGPSPTLLALGQQSLPGHAGTWLCSLRRDRDPWQTLLTSLSDLYVRGTDVRWKAVDADYPRHKVSLPTYPFERERFWIEQRQAASPRVAAVTEASAADGTTASSDSSDVTDTLYEITWPVTPRRASPDALGGEGAGSWLILSDGEELGAGLARRFSDRGVPIIVAEAGLRYDNSAGGRVIVDPQSSEDFDRLVRDATAANAAGLAGVVYCWSLAARLPADPSSTLIAEAHRQSCRGLLLLVQSLLRASTGARPGLWIVTAGAQPIGQERPALAQSTVWGLARTIAAEQPDLRTVCIDTDPAIAAHDSEALWAEISAPDGETQVAFRGSVRHAARLRRRDVRPVPDGEAVDAAGVVIRDDASYLVTGGLGGLGLHIAEWLVERGARHLVLIGRRAPSATAAARAARLEAAGAQVLVATGDVARRDDVAGVLDQLEGRMPALAGVVHAAGVFDDGVLSELEWSRFETVLAPKVAGSWHLHELTHAATLDFFVLFSSMASVLGSPSQSNYSAANAFMDALAHRRVAEGRPALSINWGPWAEAGMATLSAQNRLRLDRFGLAPMPPARALEAMTLALGHGATQVSVLPIQWDRVAETFPAGQVPPLIADLTRAALAARPAAPARGAVSTDFLNQLHETAPALRWSVVQSHVRDQVVQVLGIDPARAIDLQQGLRDLGMDSLMALELRHRLQRSVNRALPSTLAFDWPSIEAIGTHLAADVLGLMAPATAATASKAPVVSDLARSRDEPVAIVGLACRFPGNADTPEKFWDLLHDGVDAVSEVPADRWNLDELYDPDPEAAGKMYSRWGGFIQDVDRFDAPFFGISRREAISLDPQQRLLLEVSWEALEHAGQAPERLAGSRGGVFVGLGTNDYGQLISRLDDSADLGAYVGTGNSLSVAAGRLSYVLGLQGPSMAVDTACSSSLVAVHLACQSLRAGECGLALAGGVNLMLLPDVTIQCCRAHMLSPHGRCRTFDSAADGYVRAEGAGVVVLKRLSDALADGDRVHAVIRGSAVNQDGRSSGLTVPNGAAQRALIADALAAAAVAPEQVSYVEAHGTGTSLGDPIEMRAIVEALGEGRTAARPLVVGSVKTNLGHLEAAAGMAGLIKVVLALQHDEIPAHLHFNSLNPHIALDDTHVVIPTAAMPWRPDAAPRVAGVSSFGFSGTNAHLVIEEAPDAAGVAESASETAGPRLVERPLHLITLSARSQPALIALAGRLADHLDRQPTDALGDVAHTLNTGRSHFSHRLAVVAGSLGELHQHVASFSAGTAVACLCSGCIDGSERPGVAFVFADDEATRGVTGRQLYDTQATFRDVMDRCATLIGALLDQPTLATDLLTADNAANGRQPLQAGLAGFARDYAVAELWRSWGVEPSAVMGVGPMGECAAACVAGVVSLEDAVTLAAAHARVLGCAAEESAVRELERVTRGISYATPKIPFVSTVSSQAAGVGQQGDGAWPAAGAARVSLDECMRALTAQGCRVFLDMGATRPRAGSGGSLEAGASWLSSLSAARGDWEQLLESAASLYVAGAVIDWARFDSGYQRRTIALPTYPFERLRYWAEPDAAAGLTPTSTTFEQAVAAGVRQAEQGPLDLGLHTYPGKLQSLERLTTAYMVDALRRLGVYGDPGESHSADGLVDRFGVLPTYRRLVARWLDRLAREGLLVANGTAFVSRVPLPAPALALVWRDAQDLADTPYIADYVRRCGEHLTDVVTGRESPLETLFPGGNPDGAEGLYEHAASARYINGIARAAIADFALADRGGRALNVLEIGAGTGATTAMVLPALPRRTAFWFTDVSHFFLTRAAAKFRDYDFVRYGLLDIEQSPRAQGYPAQGFDIVLAANVLHATTDLRRAVTHARDLLAPGGMLVLIENTVHHPHFDLTIGLVEGWQRFDDELRSSNPLLSAEAWQRLLDDADFAPVAVVPGPASPAAILGQSVLLARAPLSELPEAALDRSWTGQVQGRRLRSVPEPAVPVEEAEDFIGRLVDAPPSSREQLLVDYVREQVTRVLRTDGDAPPQRRQRLMDLGLDSLMAVELRNRVAAGLGARVTLPATLMFDYPTIEAIARYLGKQLLGPDWSQAPEEIEPTLDDAAHDASAARLAELSDEEAEALLIERLESL